MKVKLPLQNKLASLFGATFNLAISAIASPVSNRITLYVCRQVGPSKDSSSSSSHMLDLLDVSLGAASSPPSTVDPWGMPVQPPPPRPQVCENPPYFKECPGCHKIVHSDSVTSWLCRFSLGHRTMAWMVLLVLTVWKGDFSFVFLYAITENT